MKMLRSFIIIHVHVRYLLSPVRLPVVCLLSVTFVRPTQAVQIFGNISTANTRGIAISDLSTAISRKRCKIGGKLVLITNRKSYMSFRLVPKSAILNDIERRNGVILS